jgi:putative FmdB family regulatory protein
VPIYEFVCESCGRLAEVMQKVSDPPPPCPECGDGRMARMVSRTSFKLKGGGWYADLYGSPGEKPKAAAAGGAAPGGGATAAAPKGDAPGTEAPKPAAPKGGAA